MLYIKEKMKRLDTSNGSLHVQTKPAAGTDHWLTGSDTDTDRLLSDSVAVSRGYDTCFAVKACDRLYQLIKSMRLD